MMCLPTVLPSSVAGDFEVLRTIATTHPFGWFTNSLDHKKATRHAPYRIGDQLPDRIRRRTVPDAQFPKKRLLSKMSLHILQ
jgi:hypothetical protein